MGYDAHRFSEGDHVWLCGVKVPHDHSLSGHSDADAGLHALTDAILGTIGAGDIGQHFRPAMNAGAARPAGIPCPCRRTGGAKRRPHSGIAT